MEWDGWVAFMDPNLEPLRRPHKIWAVDYPNGWKRRTAIDPDGRAIYTRWIRPEEK